MTYANRSTIHQMIYGELIAATLRILEKLNLTSNKQGQIDNQVGDWLNGKCFCDVILHFSQLCVVLTIHVYKKKYLYQGLKIDWLVS